MFYICNVIIKQNTNIMKNQEAKQGFKEAMDLQSQCDNLRSELQAMSRLGQFGQDKDDKAKLLKRLDHLFSLQCQMHDLELNKFGRLL